MEKNNIVRLAVTSIVSLLPVCLSFVVFNDLPDQLVMQWSLDGSPNWYAPKTVVVFAFPLFFLILNIVLNLAVSFYPKRESVSKVMQLFIPWLSPVFSLIIIPLFLLANLNVALPIKMIVFIFVGIVFIFIGNYLPKSRQNTIAGIRISWTLNNTENWNKTHRLAGFLWIIGGLLFIVTAFLPLENIVGIITIFTIIFMTIIVPILYSFIYHKRGN
jgi:uncharacterized membrane protein